MATIHPSRLGLVPQDPPQRRRRSPSPRRPRSRSRSPSYREKRERERDRDRDKDSQRRGRDERDKEKERYRDHSRGARGRDERNDSRGRENGRGGGESPRRNGPDGRRASPLYDDYRRPAPPVVEGQTPWRQPENMYPNRGGGRPYGAGSEGAGFLESRRAQREAMTVNVWPPSPKAPARDLSPKRKMSSKKSKRARPPSSSDETSLEEEERRRRKHKEKKRSRHDKERDKEKERRRRSPSPRRHRDDDDSDEDDQRKRRRRTRSRSKSAPQRATPSPTPEKDRSRSPTADDDDSDAWVERSPMAPPPVPASALGGKAPPTTATQANADQSDDDDEEEVGPKPLQQFGTGKRFDERAYGGALLRGEGSAMAAFLQEGTDSRIPRRGEIGLTSDEIAKYEDVGYVMSGSRHRRMNAVRMRKENQVISAEEKRGILKLQKEERERREAILREEFGELVNERLKAGDSKLK
ncbi:hypothetical protein K443DRAFT_512764 [Laccaria amethystina LaAM-08-1]|uniref:NF-kappa-B-activating protein C-terminal domain-containing protein n=1 Tax=Laccaria amethystina LaAM-08-1 TaxID=1095629 RepID=A0A0C9XCR8_9AGAR|nr:hypothetical protein K443DRAFT_512764 [Laccaria amethystina LaAM-08-1]